MDDLISREGLIIKAEHEAEAMPEPFKSQFPVLVAWLAEKIPSAEPKPLSDAYMKAVWTWLLNYQIKTSELRGKYTPYEVLSWVIDDWRKEHEPDQKGAGK